MKITINRFLGGYDGKNCYVHARASALDENNLILTMQNLNVAGCDDFSPLLVMKSADGGRTWTDPAPDNAFITEYDENGTRTLACDATHLYHKKTGVSLIACHSVSYAKGARDPLATYERVTMYSTYDEKTGSFAPIQKIAVPRDVCPVDTATGCSQFIEDENGDVLLPVVVYHDPTLKYAASENPCTTAILRLGFDGKTLTFKEMGNEIGYPTARGVGEASITFFKGKYYQTIRHDECALWSVSEDGLHFSEPQKWTWDTGCELLSYNTQAHWLQCGGKLYLVYTRKAGNNDHVFRHRAPLFMAEVDVEKMCVLRHTEEIVVPERGARLGNFGVTQINENKAIITVNEWMQPVGCEKYGSDNSLFITTVEA